MKTVKKTCDQCGNDILGEDYFVVFAPYGGVLRACSPECKKKLSGRGRS